MATAQKPSRHRSASSSGTSRDQLRPRDIARLVRQISKLTVVFEQLVGSGLLVIAQQMTHRSPRTPLPEYAKVVAIGASQEVDEIRGHTGIVLDAAQSNGEWTYTVYFPAQQETFVLHGSSLWDTGETVPEDVIYGGGKMLRVRVDDEGDGAVVA